MMSRIGKKPIEIPSGVTIEQKNGMVCVNGPKGALSVKLPREVKTKIENGNCILIPGLESKKAYAMWGMSRTLIANMIEGTTKGYEKTLQLVGVGYRAQMKGSAVNLQLGYSHDILYSPPEGIKLETTKPTEIKISGIDKQKVGQTAAEIRQYRRPEPYKGKGIRYIDEVILLKEGKKK